jgi:hypothetical protein
MTNRHLQMDQDEDEYESYTDEEEADLADENDNQDDNDDDMKHAERNKPKSASASSSTTSLGEKTDEVMSCASYSALRFVDWEEVVEIDCEYSPDETEAMWFNSDDYASFLEECENMAAAMIIEQQDGTRIACPIQLRDLIGLEAWTKEGYKKRQKLRIRSIDAVLDEQFAQWDDGVENPDSIAKLYLAATDESKDVAATKARNVEQDIQSYVLDESTSRLEAFRPNKSSRSMSAMSLTSNSLHGESSNRSVNSNKSSVVMNPADSSSTQVTALEDFDHDSISIEGEEQDVEVDGYDMDEDDDEEDDDDVEDEDDEEERKEDGSDSDTGDDSSEDAADDGSAEDGDDDDSAEDMDEGIIELSRKSCEEVDTNDGLSTSTRPPKVPVKKSAESDWKKIKGAAPVYSKYQQIVVPPSSIRKEAKTAQSSKLSSEKLDNDASPAVIASTPKMSPPQPSLTKSWSSSISASSDSSRSAEIINNHSIRSTAGFNKISKVPVQRVVAAPEIIELPSRRAPPKIKSLAGRRKPEALRTTLPPSRISIAPANVVTKKVLVKKHPPKKHAPMSSSITNQNKSKSILSGSNHSLRTSQHTVTTNYKSASNSNRSLTTSSHHTKYLSTSVMKRMPAGGSTSNGSTGLMRKSSLRPETATGSGGLIPKSSLRPGTASGSTGLVKKSSVLPGSLHNSSSGIKIKSGTTATATKIATGTPVVKKKKVPKLNTVTVRKPGEKPLESAKPKSLKFKRSGPIPVMTPVSSSKSKQSSSKDSTTDKDKKSTKTKTSTSSSSGSKKESSGGLIPKFLRRKE